MKTLFSFLFILLINCHSGFGQDALKHLYLANDTHTDLMWNADENDWYRYNLDMAKFYLNLGENTRNNAPEARSKWNYDVAWTLFMMEKHESKDFFDRIITQIQNGQASVPYNFVLPVYGASTLESVLRSMYYSGHLEREYGINIDLAVCQENATIPLGLASLWAGSGAKFSWRGVCNCATQTNTIGYRDHEIYWYTGLDGRKILMKWYSNFGWNASLGGYSEMLEPSIAVMQMDTLCGSEYYPFHIAGAFGKGWDNIHNYSYDLVWGMNFRTRPGTKLYLSNQSDFFQHFESRYGDALPEVTLAYGNEWDLNLASLSEVSGRVKRSMEKLRTAEALAAIASVDREEIFNVPETQKKDFYYGISVYNLHGWTADGPITRQDFAGYMRNQQRKITEYIDTLCTRSMLEIGKRIKSEGLTHPIFIFNSLSWERSGLVSIPVSGNFNSIKDAVSGKKYHGQIIEKNGSSYLKVWVDNIPPVGYRIYELFNEKNIDSQRVFKFSHNNLETPFYHARIEKSGAISVLSDKKNQKTWTKGLINDLGSTDHKSGNEVRIVEMGENHITLQCESDDPVKHTSQITFYADERRIDIHNTINENYKELLHFSFDFDMDDSEVWHEEVGAVIKAKLASQGGHYADRMARYDYLTLNHFVNVSNEREGITLSNADCLFFRLGDSRADYLDQYSSTIHVLAGGQVNKDQNLGIIGQDGDALFNQHFSILPHEHGFDAGESMKFALEHQNPLMAGQVFPGGDMPGDSFSFLELESRDVILWTLKPGEEGGVVIRLWNTGSTPVNTSVSFYHDILKAALTTHVETDISEILPSGKKLKLEMNQQQLNSYHLWFDVH